MRTKLAGALLVALVALVGQARAQNTVPRFSVGPTYAVWETTWDDSTGKTQNSMLDAGLGVALRFNFLRNWDERWSGLTLAVPVYMSLPANNEYRFRLGMQLETLNGLVGFGALADMVNSQTGSGALLGDFRKSNLSIVVSFGFNLGSGTPQATSTATVNKAGVGVIDNRPPPGFVGW